MHVLDVFGLKRKLSTPLERFNCTQVFRLQARWMRKPWRWFSCLGVECRILVDQTAHDEEEGDMPFKEPIGIKGYVLRTELIVCE